MNKDRIYVLVHNIRSMHNVGSVFRTSDGAGVSKIYLTGYTACPPRKEITKTALGADKTVDWEFYKDPFNVIKTLKKRGVKIVALEKNDNSKDISEYKSDGSVCMILGNEIDGVDDNLLELADNILHIPMHGEKESLNVSVAFGIGIYELAKK